MESIPSVILRSLSCCLHCGCFFPKCGLLCSKCESALMAFSSVEKEGKIPRVVLVWAPGQSDLCSKLLRALKGSWKRRAWHYYAALFVRQHYANLTLSYDHIFIVPAPAKKQAQRQHAYFWAEGLAQCLGATLFEGLRLTSKISQKKLDRAERTLIQMEVHVNSTIFENIEGKILWIFADDVYTTGATARAAYEALGRPVNFEVWTLAQRTLSCGGMNHLL